MENKETVEIKKYLYDSLYKFQFNVLLNDAKDKIVEECIKKAYRDFNRTIIGLPKEDTETETNNKRELIRKQWRDCLKNGLGKLKSVFSNQEGFDKCHKELCEELSNIEFESSGKPKLTIGQSQKWINMTLKYLLFFENNAEIAPYLNNKRFFHVPIDNIIIGKFKNVDIKINTTVDDLHKGVWSKIEEYDIYLDYQEQVREKYPKKIPIEVEFEEWIK